MLENALTVDRLQFAFTITFHYIFPQLTMGLALLILVMKSAALRTGGRVLDDDGQAGYREVQGEPFAVTALRAVCPDEALAAVLGTDVADPWSPAADEVLDRCFALAEAGADGVRLGGRPGRPALLDRLALAERIRRQTKLFTVVGAPAGHIDDLVDGLVAGRADLVAIAD